MAQEGELGEITIHPETSPQALPPRSLKRKLKNIKEGTSLMLGGYLHLESRLKEVKKNHVPETVLTAYEDNRQNIEEIYGRDTVNSDLIHHGTGAAQYSGSKYEEGVGNDYRFPLDAILHEGLNPHLDTWLSSTHGNVLSTSFATSWEYAKWYADKHQNPTNPLQWEYGDSTDWFAYYLTDTVLHEARMAMKDPKMVRKYAPMIVRGALRQVGLISKSQSKESNLNLVKLQQWVTDITSEVNRRTPPAEVLRAKTDIPGNFGVIFSLPKDEVTFFDMGHGGTYELRTSSRINPHKLKAVTVPLVRVDEYRNIADNLGLELAVLPTEAVDYHLSKFDLPKLTKERRTK